MIQTIVLSIMLFAGMYLLVPKSEWELLRRREYMCTKPEPIEWGEFLLWSLAIIGAVAVYHIITSFFSLSF